jgi:hypothetical protein
MLYENWVSAICLILKLRILHLSLYKELNNSFVILSRSSAHTLEFNRIEEMGGIYLLMQCYKPPKLKWVSLGKKPIVMRAQITNRQ